MLKDDDQRVRAKSLVPAVSKSAALMKRTNAAGPRGFLIVG